MQSNKRAAIPQSFLFDISAVQESLAAVRGSLYGNVILATDGSHPEVAQCISEVSQGKSIDMGFIADLAEDPAAVWNRVVAGEGAARRVALTPEVPSSPDAFAQRLFVSNEVDVYTRGGQAHGVPGALNAIHEKMTSILSLWAGPGGDGVNVATDRAQPFRELALLAAEVTRARSLHAAGVCRYLVDLDVLRAAPSME